MKTYLPTCIILLLFSACNTDCIQGSGNQVTQERQVEPFTSVDVSGSIKLVLQQDSVQQLLITADDNIQEHIKTRVKGGKLTVELNNICDAGPVKVYAKAKTFTGVSGSGAVEISSADRINAEDFSLDLSGSSKVSLDISAANVTTNASGSSEITLTGQAASHRIGLSGSGRVNAFDFVVADYSIEASGSSKMYINVLNSLDVNTSGSSDIEYRGNPQHVNNKQSGAGSLKRADAAPSNSL